MLLIAFGICFHGITLHIFCILPPQSPSHRSLTSPEYPHCFHSHSAGGLWFGLTNPNFWWTFWTKTFDELWDFGTKVPNVELFDDLRDFPSSCPYFCTNPGIPETPPEVMDLLGMPKVSLPQSLSSSSLVHFLHSRWPETFCRHSAVSPFPSLFVPFLPTFCSSQKLLRAAHLPNPSAFKDKLIWSYLGRAYL